jgi:hypothetical protein
MTIDEFFEKLDLSTRSALDRALCLLWFVGRTDATASATVKELCEIAERHGHPKQNATRLAQQLSADPRAAKSGRDGWRLTPRARRVLAMDLAPLISGPKTVPMTASVLPPDLFTKTRGYIESVVRQINASYDCGRYDCCAVMCRRLVETLLIEVYEAAGRANDIKGGDGNFLMLAPLLTFFDNDTAFHASRNAMKGLRDFKRLGDLSAHNRRFNAQQDDIDRVRDGLRIAAGELLVIAQLKPAI